MRGTAYGDGESDELWMGRCGGCVADGSGVRSANDDGFGYGTGTGYGYGAGLAKGAGSSDGSLLCLALCQA